MTPLKIRAIIESVPLGTTLWQIADILQEQFDNELSLARSSAAKEQVELHRFVKKVSEANWNDTPGNTSHTLFALMSEARTLTGNPISPAKIFQPPTNEAQP